MPKVKISLFIVIFLVCGLFILASPKEAFSGVAQVPGEGCCQFVDGCIQTIGENCQGSISFNEFAICNEDSGLCVSPERNIPTLSEWGLISMAGIFGIAGFMIIRRKKASA